ncbi:MAG: hAT transposon family protein [Gammaproteobacteria bacterium]|nr:hAT transposon family protein [Gammaproteobacteria bacterium]
MPFETAESLKTALFAAFEEDNILEQIKMRLIGFASDGAAVMMGKNNGLAKVLNDDVNNNIFQVHCMAHKLQLAAGHCVTSISFLKGDFEKTINKLYSFYNNKAVKRKSSLRNTAEAFGEKLYELNYIFDIRWVASELSALNKVKQNFKIIFHNFEEIHASGDFDQETKQKATALQNRITNVRFYSVLVFVMDVLKVLVQASKEFQKRTALVIGQEKLRLDLLQSIEAFKEGDGAELVYFLQHSKCFKDVRWKKCRTADLDDKDFMFDDDTDIRLRQQDTTGHSSRSASANLYPPLSEFRITFIDLLKEELESYFPEGSYSMFDCLDPKNLPMSAGEIPTFVPRIMPLASRFLHDELLAAEEFTELMQAIMALDYNLFCSHKNEDNAADFWSFYLNHDSVVPSSSIRSIIIIALSLPVGSAEAERGFSILKHTRYDRRNRLTPKHLEDVLRIRINGPTLDNFDAARYALQWLQEHMASDDPAQIRPPSSASTDEEKLRKALLKKSNLF